MYCNKLLHYFLHCVWLGLLLLGSVKLRFHFNCRWLFLRIVWLWIFNFSYCFLFCLLINWYIIVYTRDYWLDWICSLNVVTRGSFILLNFDKLSLKRLQIILVGSTLLLEAFEMLVKFFFFFMLPRVRFLLFCSDVVWVKELILLHRQSYSVFEIAGFVIVSYKGNQFGTLVVHC